MPRAKYWAGWPAKAALALMGKNKPTYTPFLDTGDHVVVVNAAKVRLTGRKEEQKIYRRHSGYPGGLTETKARTVRETRPVRMVEEAIQGMLPKTKLGKQMYRKLQVYAGPKHPHEAQKPVSWQLRCQARRHRSGISTTSWNGPPQTRGGESVPAVRARARSR